MLGAGRDPERTSSPNPSARARPYNLSQVTDGCIQTKSRSLDNSSSLTKHFEPTSDFKTFLCIATCWDLGACTGKTSKHAFVFFLEISMCTAGNGAASDLGSDPGQLFFCMTYYHQHPLTEAKPTEGNKNHMNSAYVYQFTLSM